MKLLKEICRGILIGVANIIPGVSGGTLAVSMGVYDKIIYALTHIRKEFKQSLKILVPVGIGAVIGLIGLSFVIKWLFEYYPIQTNFLFIGLIIGGLPAIFKRMEGERKGLSHGIAFLLMFALVVLLPLLGSSTASEVILTADPLMMGKMFLIGIIAAATMVVPGVSGSMILLILGFYQPILREITQFMVNLATLNLSGLTHGILLLTPMAVGIIAGVVIIAKIIEYLFEHFEAITFAGIGGLILGSPIAILYEANFDHFNLFSGVTGLAAGRVTTGSPLAVVGA